MLGIGRVHRYPLVELKCVSPKRRKEMAARLGGEPGGARRVELPHYGRFRSLFRSGTCDEKRLQPSPSPGVSGPRARQQAYRTAFCDQFADRCEAVAWLSAA